MANNKDSCMLIDESTCAGCEGCTVVCKQVYDIPKGLFRTKIKTVETGSYPDVVTVFNKKACLHCTEAACVMACPTRAIHKNEQGLTVINKKLCIKCNYCAANCPYGAISFDRSGNVMEKCTLCSDRIEAGGIPLCAEVCNTRAIRYGTREDMIAAGNKRVGELKNQGFVNASLYGETQLGGLNVLKVIKDTPEKYTLPADPQIPLGLKIWRFLPLTPAVFIAGGAALAFNFLHSRKYGEMNNKGPDKKDVS